MSTEQPQEKIPIARKASRAAALLKVMVWGEPGAGKTRLALSFPAPLVIDLERGSELYAEEFDFFIATPTADRPAARLVKDVVAEVLAGTYPDRKTLVIDPITDYLDALEGLLIEEQRKRGVDLDALKGPKRAQVYAAIRDGVRERLDLLIRVPMNVVLVARAKNVWSVEDGKMQPTGRTYDAKDIVEYLCDVVLHLERADRAIVRKSRVAALPETLDAPSYAALAAAMYRPAPAPAATTGTPTAQPAAEPPGEIIDWMRRIQGAVCVEQIDAVRADLLGASGPKGKARKTIEAAADLRRAELMAHSPDAGTREQARALVGDSARP